MDQTKKTQIVWCKLLAFASSSIAISRVSSCDEE